MGPARRGIQVSRRPRMRSGLHTKRVPSPLSSSSCRTPSTMENAGKTTPFGGPGRGFESHPPRQLHGCRHRVVSRYAVVAQSDRAGKRFLDSCLRRRRFSVSMSCVLILRCRRLYLSMPSGSPFHVVPSVARDLLLRFFARNKSRSLAALGMTANKRHISFISSVANAGGTTPYNVQVAGSSPARAIRLRSSVQVEQETFRHYLS